ncbi:MAG: crossover junction endodeoxyribonuclease RuvC [Gemmatimonadota bacterium]
MGPLAVRVLGVDPGAAATGYGVVEREGGTCRLVECGVIRPARPDALAERLRRIHEELLGVIDRLEPDCLAVEGVFHGENVRSAVVLAHARGAVLLAGSLRGLEVAEYPPAEIKKAVVGTGRATKEQVGYMVQKLLHLAEPPRPADAADGCAAALCHLHVSRPALRSGTA